MKRRDFIRLLGGAAAFAPLAARAQQGERVKRIGVLSSFAADDSEGQARLTAFVQGLAQLGWIDGRNVRIEYRWSAGDDDRNRKDAAEMAALAPDVILASSSSTVGALLQATRTVPTVFLLVADPVGAGFVTSLAHPGGNATGFANFEYGMSTKWVELLKQVAPQVTRAAVLRDTSAAGIGEFSAMQTMASAKGVELLPINVSDVAAMEAAVSAFARSANGGLILASVAFMVVHRALIIALAAKHKLPAVYFGRYFVKDGGLISYGPDFVDQYRQAAGYVDRILKGEKPADLPVQLPTKYQLAVNLKTAKALGLTIPASLIATADEVIE